MEEGERTKKHVLQQRENSLINYKSWIEQTVAF